MISRFYPEMLQYDETGTIKLGQIFESLEYVGVIVATPTEETPIVKIFSFEGIYKNFTEDQFNKLEKTFVKFI